MDRGISLLRRIGIALLAIACWSEVSLAATITVTTTNDENGDNNGDCSLREAIIAANTNSNAHELGCVAGNSSPTIDVIVLPASGVFLLSLGQLDITEGVTIHGSNSTIDAQNLSRVFYVNSSSGVVTLEDMVITRGSINYDSGGCVYNTTGSALVIEDTVIQGCSAPTGQGGGLANFGQTVLTRVTIEGNTAAVCGGGVTNGGDIQIFLSLIRTNNTVGNQLGGAGICNVSQAYLEDVIVENNQAEFGGGGIANVDILPTPATLTMIRGEIRQNRAGELGGGLLNGSGGAGATARLLDVTVQGNVAIHIDDLGIGGGIANIAGEGGIAELELIRVTVSYNELDVAPNISAAQLLGAGVANFFFEESPGTARARLTNVTISSNEALISGGKIGIARGGGIYNNAEMIISHVTIAFNRAQDGGSGIFDDGAAITTIRSSIVATDPLSSPSSSPSNCQGTLESQGYNLFYETGCDGLHPTDIVGQDPLLGPLQNNGGLTQTHELLPNSPARDYVPLISCLDADGNSLNQDQRTDPRPKGPGCDIGAFEARPLAVISVQKRAQDLNAAPLLTDDIVLYTIQISNTGPGDQDNHIGPEFVDPIPVGTVYVSGSATATWGTITFNAGSNQIEWDGNLPAGTNVIITFQVQVTVRSRGSGFIDLNNKNQNFWWKGLFGFGCLLAGLWARRRPRLALVLLLLTMPTILSACAPTPCVPVQICNQGFFYTDDPISRLAEIIPSDNPDTSIPNDPTCLR